MPKAISAASADILCTCFQTRGEGQAEAEGGQSDLGDRETAHDEEDDCEKKSQVDDEIQARFVEDPREEFRRYAHDPLPMQKEMEDEGGGEGDAQPLMEGGCP